MSLRQKATAGVFWSFIDSSGTYLVHFVIGIILARLLSPEEFGLIGLVTVFLAISQELIDSGFTQALIKKKNVNEIDFNTVFYANLSIGLVCAAILYGFAGFISHFYKHPDLKTISQLLSISILINSFGIVETAKLKREIDFKTQTKVSLFSSIVSGIVGVVLAFWGFGVWSLVWKTISQSLFRVLFLYIYSKWIPSICFSFSVLKEMFSFGSKVLAVGLLNAVYKNVLYVVIGKWFEPVQLGYYTRAQQFSDLPSKNLTTILQKVSYPVLAAIPDEEEKLPRAYRQLITKAFFVTCIIMSSLYGLSEEVIRILIGDKWIPAIPYLKWTCLISVFYPISAINYNVFLVKNKPSLSLIFEIIKKALVVPVIICGVIYGIKILLIGMFIHSALSYFIISFYSGAMINYPTLVQLKDISKSVVLSFIIVMGMGLIDYLSPISLVVSASLKLLYFIGITYLVSSLLRIEEYADIVQIVQQYLRRTMDRFRDKVNKS